MSTMINTCANIMELQFGSDKCVKLHNGKNHTLTYEAKERLMYGKKNSQKRKMVMKYLLISMMVKQKLKQLKRRNNLERSCQTTLKKNQKNLRDKINRYIGNVTKIVNTLNERPFGPFTVKAAKLMEYQLVHCSILLKHELI